MYCISERNLLQVQPQSASVKITLATSFPLRLHCSQVSFAFQVVGSSSQVRLPKFFSSFNSSFIYINVLCAGQVTIAVVEAPLAFVRSSPLAKISPKSQPVTWSPQSHAFQQVKVAQTIGFSLSEIPKERHTEAHATLPIQVVVAKKVKVEK